MNINIFDTVSEAVAALEENNYGNVDLVVNPPPNDNYLSDEEASDDNIGIAEGASLPSDVTGTLVMTWHRGERMFADS